MGYQKEKRERMAQRAHSNIVNENIPNLWKELGPKIQEANRTSKYLNPEKPSPNHIMLKLSKFNEKEFSRQPG